MTLQGKTHFISGGSIAVGLANALRAAKTAEPHTSLPVDLQTPPGVLL